MIKRSLWSLPPFFPFFHWWAPSPLSLSFPPLHLTIPLTPPYGSEVTFCVPLSENVFAASLFLRKDLRRPPLLCDSSALVARGHFLLNLRVLFSLSGSKECAQSPMRLVFVLLSPTPGGLLRYLRPFFLIPIVHKGMWSGLIAIITVTSLELDRDF